MLLPIGDDNPRERTPYVNYTILSANIAVFLLFCFPTPGREVLIHFALRPSALDPSDFVTSMFLHANLMHLIGNMLFLWIFGDNVEDRLGHTGYAVFYLACGLGADFLHIATTSHPDIPMLGASGAISGVVGAYVVFFPRHRVKMLLVFVFIQVFRVPAFWWVGFWFAEQIFFAARGLGGVAYFAHVGGFLVGAAVGAVVRVGFAALLPRARVPAEIREPSRTGGRPRPFITLQEEPAIEWIDEPADRWAVLRLADELHHVAQTAGIAAAVTGEEPAAVTRRLEATRGLIAHGLSRDRADRIRQDLHVHGIPAAIIAEIRTNLPPEPEPVRSASWDRSRIRLNVGTQVHEIPWPAPFLYLAARVGGTEFLDLFVSRRAAFRITHATPLVEIDTFRRRELPAGPADFARAVMDLRSGAALNDGVRVLAHRGAWGWLSFRDHADYSNYAFWVYNLILSRADLHRI